MINLKAVIRELKKSNRIAIYSKDNQNLITNTQFMLTLNDDEFWEIRAALRLKVVNTWYTKSKKDKKNIFCIYHSSVDKLPELLTKIQGAAKILLLDTNLQGSVNDLTVHYLAKGTAYICLQTKYFDMFNQAVFKQEVSLKNAPLLIDDIHLVCPYRVDTVDYYLRPLGA